MKVETKKVSLSYRQTVYTCKACGKKFKSKKACKSRIPLYCSITCWREATVRYADMVFICAYCGKEFTTDKAYRGWHPQYCSQKCSGEAQKGKTPWNKGIPHSPQIRKALSEGRKNSPKCKGPNLYNWKGGDATFRERTKIYQNERRARFVKGGKIDGEFLRYLLAEHHGLCFYCEQPLTDYKCLEHLTPLSRGGGNQPFNFVYSCKSCNSKKRQKSLEDFAIETGRTWLIDKWDIIFARAYGKMLEARNEI